MINILFSNTYILEQNGKKNHFSLNKLFNNFLW